jgi:hypothetical protein
VFGVCFLFVSYAQAQYQPRPAAGGGAVATDAIWDAKGDLAIGTGADTAVKLTIGANDTIAIADSAQTTGVRWGTPASIRTALGLVIGTNVEAWDTDLNTWATLTPSANLQTMVPHTFAQMRTDLGLVIGTNVEAWDTDLNTWATLTPSANFQTMVPHTFAQMRTDLGLVIGTNVEAWDADLDTWAGITPGTNVATFLGTPISANLRSALTDESGTGAALFDGATLTQLLTFATGTTSLAAFNIPAGTLKITPAAGDFERDANCAYATTDAGNRGYIPLRQIIRADSTVTQANDANPHAIFTTPTNGRLTLATGTYRFHGQLAWTAMSATSGNLKIDVLGAGTATVGSWLWSAEGQDAAAGGSVGAGTQFSGQWNVTSVTSTSALLEATATAAFVIVDGTFEVTGAGTIIPTQTVKTAAPAVLSVGSFIEFWRVGSTTMTSVGAFD